MAIVSKKNSLRKEDLEKALQNAKNFLAPLALIYLAFVIINVQDAGFAWSDFVPDNAVITAISLYALNFFNDLIKKFKGVKRYK